MNRDTDRLDPAFDPRIADWLETDPDRAPGEVIDTILAALPSIPQRRATLGRSWRFRPMPTTAKLALTAVAVVAVGLVGFTFVRGPAVVPAASPTPETSASPPAPPPLTERFDSALNGLSLDYPAGWQVRPATERWTDGVLGFDASGVDVIFHPALQDDLYFALVSEPLDGQPPAEWSPRIQGTHICYEGGGGGHGGGAYEPDGAVSGFAWTVFRCGGGGQLHSLVAATPVRGYVIQLYVGDDRLAETYNWDWFEAVLGTVELHPESAR